ncbi:MAG: MGMT family protein [Actinomycetota bacterium]|nr:MGMT family protein [Actinomycetota bacterium]
MSHTVAASIVPVRRAASDRSRAASARRAGILDRVRAIPAGWVRTYGDLSPGAPRLTGAVLRSAADPALPWHRVVRADGSLAKGEAQRALLTAEGVPFDAHGHVELSVARLPTEHVDPA